MINKDHNVGDNCMIMRSFSIQKDNLKCKKQDSNRLGWQPQASNDPLWNSNKTNNFTVYHQNIRNLLNKTEELIHFMSPDFPRYFHLKHSEIDFMYRDQYILGAKFCRKSLKSGGVSIFFNDTFQCTNINCMNFVMNKTLQHMQLGLTLHP